MFVHYLIKIVFECDSRIIGMKKVYFGRKMLMRLYFDVINNSKGCIRYILFTLSNNVNKTLFNYCIGNSMLN